MELHVDLGKDSYDLLIEQGLLNRARSTIQRVFQGEKIMILSDDTVYGLYGEALTQELEQAFTCFHYCVPPGEASKDFQVLPGIYDALLEAKLSRSDLIVALGGGVVGDLAGFVAATYLRGIL